VIIVDRVFPNTPAEDAGVREGDRVVAVDTTKTTSLPIAKVSDLLRGEPGSQVNVTYTRPAVTEPIKLRFTRRVIHVPAVAYSGIFGDHIGYIPLQTFNENAAEEVATAITQLVEQGAKGIVLDMRGNGGGIVDQALKTSSLFLRDGQEIASVGRTSRRSSEVGRPPSLLSRCRSSCWSTKVDVALRSSPRTATTTARWSSANLPRPRVGAVIVSVGRRLPSLTTGKWYTPSGRSIHQDRGSLSGALVEVRLIR
jgi:carboxyl-terminal processing protease